MCAFVIMIAIAESMKLNCAYNHSHYGENNISVKQ